MTNKQYDIMGEALGETGIMPFYEGDAALISELCEIIGELHRGLRACKNAVEDGSIPPSARMELVKDYATPLLNRPILREQTR